MLTPTQAAPLQGVFPLRPAAAGLPALPEDPSGNGRHVSWVIIASAPGFHHPVTGAWRVVDQAWILHQADEYARLCASGYHAPVIREHKHEGLRFGDVLDLRLWQGEDGLAKLLAAVAWAEVLDAEERILTGQLRFVSGGWGRLLRPDRGAAFEEVLLELSLVAAPHLKTAGARHILNQEESTPMAFVNQSGDRFEVRKGSGDFEVLSTFSDREEAEEEVARLHRDNDPDPSTRGENAREAWIRSQEGGTENQESDMDMQAMMEMLQRLSDRLDALEAAGEGMDMGEGGRDPSDSDPDPEAELRQQLSEQQAQIAALELQNKRHAFRQTFPAGAVIELTPELADFCFRLSQADAEAFDALAQAAKAPETPPETAPAPAAPAPSVNWAVQMGQGGGAGGPAPKTVTVAEVVAEAKQAGVEPWKLQLQKEQAGYQVV